MNNLFRYPVRFGCLDGFMLLVSHLDVFLDVLLQLPPRDPYGT